MNKHELFWPQKSETMLAGGLVKTVFDITILMLCKA